MGADAAVKANVDADAAVKAEVAWRVESGVSLQLAAFVVLAFLAVAEVFFFNLFETHIEDPSIKKPPNRRFSI